MEDRKMVVINNIRLLRIIIYNSSKHIHTFFINLVLTSPYDKECDR